MWFDEAVQTYGCWAVLFGPMLEGEAVLLSAGFFVSQGYLSFPLVAVVAFGGTVAVDQFFFFVGRTTGRRFVHFRPSLSSRLEVLEGKIDRYKDMGVFGFRFAYGLRGMCAFVAGACRISPLRFTVLNTAGAVIWIGLFIACGYCSGAMANRFFPGFSNTILWIASVLIALAVALRRVCRVKPREYPYAILTEHSYEVH